MPKKLKKKTVAKKAAKKKTVAKKALPVPKGYHTVSPHLIVRDAAQAIEWYKKAFAAKERYRMGGPDGKIMHAEIQVGDSIIMLSDEMPPQQGQVNERKAPTSVGGSTGGLMLYVKDVDSWFKRAVGAGGRISMPLMDMFWGDRYGQLVDPYGHTWALATHKRDLSPKQMQKAMEEAMKQMPQQQQAA